VDLELDITNLVPKDLEQALSMYLNMAQEEELEVE
jgi:hypothetical protein